jgi:micrococcal nuclease
MYNYEAILLRVIDGDTVHLMVDLGMDVQVACKCRLWGINAPEMNTEEGKKAKAYLEGLLPLGCRILVRTFKDRKEKYGRYLVIISSNDKDEIWSINEKMIAAGHAVRYMDT